VTAAVAAVTGATERELGWACELMHATLSVAVIEDTDAIRQVRSEALERFEQFQFATALSDGTTVHHANAAWRAMFGATPQTWIESSLDAVLRTRIKLHVPEVMVRIGERRTWLAATLIPLGPGTAVVVCEDMTDAAIARELQVASDALVWSGSVSTPTVADYLNGHMRELNRQGLALSWQSIVHSEDLPKWHLAFGQATRQRTTEEVELRLQRDDNQYRWHTVRVVVTSANTRWFSIATDAHRAHVIERERGELLDRLRAARIDAEHAHKVKDQVLAAVSHELRAPVTTMMLWERVLRDPTADAAARVQALDAIHQSAFAQSRIVADLLDMSRAISGKLYVDFRDVDIGRVVGDSVEAARPAATAKRIALSREGSFTGEISGDASRLRQVLDNLLSNAIKFTEAGGQVTVSMQRKGRIVVIVVKDNGHGIAPAELNRIFEPFSQGSDLFARRAGGLGLGLAIAKQIVELHHGTLTAFSEGLNRGARLTLTLPVAGQRRAPSPPAGIVSPRALKSVRVLVIDDDERVRNALALLLDRAGAIVDRAESAFAAREQMARRDPQVIVCDIAMPDEDGYEFIRSLRASGNKIPAIALTAYATQADAEQAVSAGFDLHVAKPVDFQRLVASLTHVIDSRRSKMTV